MNLVEEYVALSGKIAAIMVVCAALGEMAIPLTLASMFRDPSIPWFVLMIVLEICAIFCLLLLGLFLYVARKKVATTGPAFVPLQDMEGTSSANLLATPSTALENTPDGGEEEKKIGED